MKEVQGLENIPQKGGVILAANHSSFLDPVCLVAVVQRPISFLAAEKLFKHPLWLPLVFLTRQIKVDRQSKDKSASLANALKVLSRGEILGIFPEGTRSRSGVVQKAYGGVVRLSKNAKCVIVPINIQGAFEILPPGVWFPKLRKQIVIHIGVPLYIHEYIDDSNEKNDFVKVANEVVMKRIMELEGNNK